jgi:hypothetical protein
VFINTILSDVVGYFNVLYNIFLYRKKYCFVLFSIGMYCIHEITRVICKPWLRGMTGSQYCEPAYPVTLFELLLFVRHWSSGVLDTPFLYLVGFLGIFLPTWRVLLRHCDSSPQLESHAGPALGVNPTNSRGYFQGENHVSSCLWCFNLSLLQYAMIFGYIFQFSITDLTRWMQ